MIPNLNLKNGKVLFDDFNIPETEALELHADELKEDMLQVEFPNGYILDIGWRPSFDLRGNFFAVVVKNFDWEKPTYSATAHNLAELRVRAEEALLTIPN